MRQTLHLRSAHRPGAGLADRGRARPRRALGAVVGSTLALAAAGPARADDKPVDGTNTDPAAKTLAYPAFSPTLTPNPTPARIEAGPLGPVFVTGLLSGVALGQSNPIGSDRGERIDLSNARIFIQKPDGAVQFVVDAGLYKLTSLGTPDRSALDWTRQFFGPVPVAFVKLVPNEMVSVMAGKLPTLIGPESPFTFQNFNIQRGLLFNQTNTVSRGVQANYSAGSVTVSAALTDGFYSDRFNWATGAVTWKIDDANTLYFNAGANLGRTAFQTIAAPLAQNNSSIYDLVYTYASGPWTLSPYIQYSNVPRDNALGFAAGASTLGAAVLGSYAVTDEFKLAARLEYIAQTGDRASPAPTLVYGPGSRAVSATFTPTYQRGRYFARAGFSYVKAYDVAAGAGFGHAGDRTTEARALLETGVIF